MRVFARYVQRCRIQYGTSGPKTITQFFNVMNIIWTRYCTSMQLESRIRIRFVAEMLQGVGLHAR